MSAQSSDQPAPGDLFGAEAVLRQLRDSRSPAPDVTVILEPNDDPGSTFDDVFGLDY